MNKIKDIVVLILAGGKSERFWPLSNKNLINFSGKNLIEHHIGNLTNIGIHDFIVICSSEVAAFLRVNIKNTSNVSINRVLQDDYNHGIGKALLLAKDLLLNKYAKRPIYVINCDDIYDEKLHKEVFRKFISESLDTLMVSAEINDYKPLGFFNINNDLITELVEKPAVEKLPSKLANMSLHLYSDIETLIKLINEEINNNDKNDDLYERAVNKLCKIKKISNLTYKGEWITLKFPWDVLNASAYFLTKIKNRISEKAVIDKWAKITPPVIIEEGVKILEFARVVGPVVIKKNTVIGTGSLIRDSIIGENCVAGYHTEITRSFIGNNCWFHSNYIGDSVLGNKVNMGAGSVLANLRLDEKSISSVIKNIRINTGKNKFGGIIGNGVQIGVNSSIMPGIKLGKNSVVGANTAVYSDLEDGMILFTKIPAQKKNKDDHYSASSRKDFRNLLKL